MGSDLRRHAVQLLDDRLTHKFRSRHEQPVGCLVMRSASAGGTHTPMGALNFFDLSVMRSANQGEVTSRAARQADQRRRCASAIRSRPSGVRGPVEQPP